MSQRGHQGGIVTPHQSQVGISVGNASGAQYVGAGAFMTPGQAAMPGALQQLAHGMDKLGGAVNDMMLERQRRQNDTDLLALHNRVKDNYRAFDADFKKNNKGISARDAEAAYGAFFDKEYQEARKEWGGNTHLLQRLDMMFSPLRQAGLDNASAYSIREEAEYEKQELAKGEMDLMRDAANPFMSLDDKSKELAGFKETMRMMARGRIIDPEIAAVDQRFVMEHMKSLVAVNKFGAAQNFVKNNMAMFGDKANDALITVNNMAKAAQMKAEAARRREETDRAYQYLYTLPYTQQLEIIQSPERLKELGFNLDVKQAMELEGMLNTAQTHRRQADKNAREDYESGIMTEAVNMALSGDPVEGYRIINESTLDGKTKPALRKAFENAVFDVDDPAFVADLHSRIANNEHVSEVDLALGVATGKVSFATKDRLKKLAEEAAGPLGEMKKNALRQIRESFRKSIMADGTPEQAAAEKAAYDEALLAMEDAEKKGKLYEFLAAKDDPVLEIATRHQLSIEKQMQANMNRIKREERQAEEAKKEEAKRAKQQEKEEQKKKQREEYEEFDRRWGEKMDELDEELGLTVRHPGATKASYATPAELVRKWDELPEQWLQRTGFFDHE
jgi:hypothetical protein